MSELAEPGTGAISLADVLHALSDPTRLLVVAQLDDVGEQLCGALRVSVAKSTLSHHLRVLRRSGVTHTRPAGTQRWLSLRRNELDARFPGLLDSVLASIPLAVLSDGLPVAIDGDVAVRTTVAERRAESAVAV
jgi:DNA-binding transcriptional ArsR family regulator